MEGYNDIKNMFNKHFKNLIKEAAVKPIGLDVQKLILKKILEYEDWNRIFTEKVEENHPHEIGENIIEGVENGYFELETGFNLTREYAFNLNYTVYGIFKQGKGYDHEYDNYMETSFDVDRIEVDILSVIDNTDDIQVKIEEHLISEFEKELNKFI